MSNEQRNYSEENVTDDSKGNKLIKIIKNDQKNNYGSYAALISVVLTIAGIIVKGMSTIAIAGYNNYFSISSTYNHISEANIISNLFNILFYSIILLSLNFLMAYVIIKVQSICKSVLYSIVIFVVSIIIVCTMFDYCWFKGTISYILSCLRYSTMLCVLIYCCGFASGIAIRNMKWFDKPVDKVISTIDKKTNAKKNSKIITITLICFLVIIVTSCIFYLGEAFAQLKRDYRLIDNNSKVILAEKDDMYLCADCKYDESSKQLYIYTSRQICINSLNVKMRAIKVDGVSISKSH